MALNFVHCNGRQIPMEVLRRRPNPAQSKVFARLRQLIEASSCDNSEFALASGRRGTHVLARLDELQAYLLSNGVSAEAYQPPVPSGTTVPRDDSGAPALKPYSDARADRLLITGRGHWDISPFLGPELQLPFLEPRVLLGCDTFAPYPDTSREDQAELLKVFALWDSLGLLSVVPAPSNPRSLCRIFGAYKSPLHDRMIGDRRGPNGQEGRLIGVSHELPQGSLLCLYSVKPGFALCGASTDRSDYYHQVAVSKSRATSNAVGPPLPLSALSTTSAYVRFLQTGVAELRAHENCVLGRCGKKAFSLGVGDPLVCGAFSSLFQGDHGGVEYATAAHEGLLLEADLLSPEQRLTAGRPPPLDDCAQALVIDDFFAVCQLPASNLIGLPEAELQEVLHSSPASECIRRAKTAYGKVSLGGSDRKDNYGSLRYTVAGAEVTSDARLAQQGTVLVGAPLAKRFALSYVSLKTSCLPAVSEGLASSLLGGKAACELSLLAACAPLIVTNVAVPYDDYVYCTDASLAKGAACRALVGKDLSEALWHSSPRRGPFARLSKEGSPSKTPPSSPSFTTRSAEVQVEERQAYSSRGVTGRAERQVEASSKTPPSSPSFAARNAKVQVEERYAEDQAVAVQPSWSCGGASQEKVQVEVEVPPVSGQCFTYFRFAEVQVAGRAVSSQGAANNSAEVQVEAEARTGPRFSSEVSPELDVTKPAPLEALLCLIPRRRVRRVLIDLPGGPCAQERHEENRRASRAFIILEACHRAGVPCLLRQPAGSLLFTLSPSPAPADESSAPGLESILVDDVLLTSCWEVLLAWRWGSKRHINALESDATLALYKRIALEGGDRRCAIITDSSVVLGAHSKGRTSARVIKQPVRKASTTVIAGGVYPGLSFGPTRWNVADDPTRSEPLRKPSGVPLCYGLSRDDLRALSALRGLSKPRANWVRLALGLSTEVTGRALGSYFEAKPFDTENFVELIIAFGRDLYNSGRPYWHYSETINALTALKPALRRACQGAWDLAFTWLADEPSSHHLALPPILLMAILGVCLAWGWVREAAIFSLSWGALLRISEATSATRGHLVFPKDALWMQSYVLIKIDQPKTRGRAAKHQSAKLEPADLVDIVRMAFQELPKHCKLWPHANQTLRRRLDAVLKRLGISGSSSHERGVDLGSFRPENDSELVRRRGRWVSMKVMEIYLQEVASSTYVADLPLQSREAVLYMAQLYPEILKTTMRWNENNIPSSSWWYLWP
ncbi:unnamed protein product [Symbiodinium sp. CCMP2456]|nr:unnamed protein product [Symbiodinium sp. CCMP2456]